jgi:DNA polymerase III epsilon subunit-like protein
MLISVIDTETTGLDPVKHEVIQLGLIEYKLDDSGNLILIREHEFKLSPQNIETADQNALKINGYHPRRWLDADNFDSIVPMLDRIWSTSDLLLGQNLIFDLRFITKEYSRLGMKRPKFPKYLDTKHMGSCLVKEGIIRSSSMDNMCKYFDIKFKGRAHTALTDCQRTVTLWETLQKYAPQQQFTYEEPYDPHASKNARKLNG